MSTHTNHGCYLSKQGLRRGAGGSRPLRAGRVKVDPAGASERARSVGNVVLRSGFSPEAPVPGPEQCLGRAQQHLSVE